MARSKYLWLFVGFAISVATFIAIVVLAEVQKTLPGTNLIPKEYVEYFVNFLPGNLFTDLIFLYFIPIGIMLLFLVIGVPMVKGLINIHRFAHRGARFGINPLGPKVSGFKLFKRALFIGLFAFSITSMVADAGYASLFRAGTQVISDTFMSALFEAEAIFIGTFFITGILIILMLPFWLMEDAGVLIHDVRPENRQTPNISGVHLWYVDFFEGYAGISAIISLVTIIYGIMNNLSFNPQDPSVLTPIILIILPFITSGLLTIPIVLYERSLPKLAEKLQKKLDSAKYPEVKIPLHDQVKVQGK